MGASAYPLLFSEWKLRNVTIAENSGIKAAFSLASRVVARIDNTYGDRHLFCSCPPAEAFATERSQA